MLASVSRVFKDILPQPGEEREDTVIILADWEEEDVRSAVTMLYCGALAYRAGARDKVGRVAALPESVGVKGFEEEVVDMEQKDEQSNANLVGLQIMDIRTIPTEELKGEVISELDQLADGDLVLCGDIRQPDATVTVSSSGENGRYQCFRCGGEFSSKPEYKLHLEEHTKDSKKCISKLKVNLKEGVKNTDWMCESCYIILLNDGGTNNLLPSRQFGYVVLTTSGGIMDHEEARRKHLGGKIRDSSSKNFAALAIVSHKPNFCFA